MNEALGFAALASLNINEKNMAIFELNIDEIECEIDTDEEKFNAIVTHVKFSENSCFRINRDLLFGN